MQKNIRSSENSNRLFETYKNSVMPHGRHIYAISAYMAMATMCAYTPSQHAWPHWKCVLRCCSNCPCIDLPDQETDMHYSNTSPLIRLHIYHWIARCTVHARRPLDEKKMYRLCFQDTATVTPEKLYARKELVMMKTSIADFHTSFYIPEIEKLALLETKYYLLQAT